MLEFRSKTIERFTLEQLITLENLIHEIMEAPVHYVEESIWDFTWDPQDIAGYYGFGEELSEKQIKAIRAEIINHYRAQNPSWDYGKKYTRAPYSEKASIIALRKAVFGDEIIIQKVMDNILEYIQNIRGKIITSKNFKQTRELLASPYEKPQFYGIHQLGFRCLEAEFLQPYAKEIGDVLEEMYAE